jgi:hypothetical protein
VTLRSAANPSGDAPAWVPPPRAAPKRCSVERDLLGRRFGHLDRPAPPRLAGRSPSAVVVGGGRSFRRRAGLAAAVWLHRSATRPPRPACSPVPRPRSPSRRSRLPKRPVPGRSFRAPAGDLAAFLLKGVRAETRSRAPGLCSLASSAISSTLPRPQSRPKPVLRAVRGLALLGDAQRVPGCRPPPKRLPWSGFALLAGGAPRRSSDRRCSPPRPPFPGRRPGTRPVRRPVPCGRSLERQGSSNRLLAGAEAPARSLSGLPCRPRQPRRPRLRSTRAEARPSCKPLPPVHRATGTFTSGRCPVPKHRVVPVAADPASRGRPRRSLRQGRRTEVRQLCQGTPVPLAT